MKWILNAALLLLGVSVAQAEIYRMPNPRVYRAARERAYRIAYDRFIVALDAYAAAYVAENVDALPKARSDVVRRWRSLQKREPWFREEVEADTASEQRDFRAVYGDLIQGLNSFYWTYTLHPGNRIAADVLKRVQQSWAALRQLDPDLQASARR